MEDVLFCQESVQAVYNYFKDVPSWVVNCFSLLATADGWTTFSIFLYFFFPNFFPQSVDNTPFWI